jgi:hypothetical protein
MPPNHNSLNRETLPQTRSKRSSHQTFKDFPSTPKKIPEKEKERRFEYFNQDNPLNTHNLANK